MKDHPYQLKDSDIRSPCPMVNTLANHGFLPRNGRDVKPNDIYQVLLLLRFTPVLSASFIAFIYSHYNEALPDKSALSTLGFTNRINLNQLRVYDVLEHDVSLTRQDTALFPHNTTLPDPKYINRMVRLVELKNANTQKEGYFTRENEHDARKLRWLESARDNQAFHYPFFQQFTSSFECRVLLDVIGRDGQVRMDHFLSFLQHERIPDDWYPPLETPSVVSVFKNTLECWKGLRSSNVTLDLLNELD